jgi:manganese transport protein
MQLGFAIIPLIHFTGNKALMGKFAISMPVKIMAWIVASVIIILNINLVVNELKSLFYSTDTVLWLKVLVALFFVYIGALLVYVIIEPLIRKHKQEFANIPHGEAVNISELQIQQYDVIGVTLDFSIKDEKVIHHALQLGGRNAVYHLMHVVQSAGALRMNEAVNDAESAFDWINLNKYRDALLEQGYKVQVHLGYGSTVKAIGEWAKTTDIQLLVMGAHGHKGIKDIIFGTTLDKVRHYVDIPVFIVK